MDTAIELHDSELSAVTFDADSAVVSLAPAYLHHAGSGWVQPAALTFHGVSPVAVPTELPAWVSSGFLRIDGTVYDGLIPASGSFTGSVEFSVVLVTAQTLSIRAEQVSITLLGERSYVEPLPWVHRRLTTRSSERLMAVSLFLQSTSCVAMSRR